MNDLDLYLLENSAIKSRHDFVRFLSALLANYQKTGGNWENQNLEHFLEALVRYTADADGYYHNIAETSEEKVDADIASWRVFADLLRGATMYE